MHTLHHVLGSGDATNPGNHIAHARLDGLPNDAHVMLYGRQQPGMKMSEADSAMLYLETRERGDLRIYDMCHGPKSTAESLAIVVRYLHDSYIEFSHIWIGDEPGVFKHHVVFTNWPYVLRTRYLLRKQWERLYPEVPWANVSRIIIVQGVDGTFQPYFEELGFKAIPWWLWKVAVRECGAWVKAFIDPFDERLNQQRGAAKVF